MKIILIILIIVFGIPIVKAMIEAVQKTSEQNTFERIVLKRFLKRVNERNDLLDIKFDKETARILELDVNKVFRLAGKVISYDDEDFTGYLRERYEKYVISDYLDYLTNELDLLGIFKEVRKIDRLGILEATKRGEKNNYRYRYSVNKWVIETNASFYIVFATFSKDKAKYFAFGMVDY